MSICPRTLLCGPEAVISMPTAWSRDWVTIPGAEATSYYEYIRFRSGSGQGSGEYPSGCHDTEVSAGRR